MLSAAEYPARIETVAQWFAHHVAEWEEGRAFRFSIWREERMIGLTDLEIVADGEASLGYWIDRSAWGYGFASEAARAIISFGFGTLGIETIRAGHAADNAASARVLTKLGFALVGTKEHFSRPRGHTITQWQYRLSRP